MPVSSNVRPHTRRHLLSGVPLKTKSPHHSQWVLFAFAAIIAVSTSGCGKSKQQIAAEAEKQRLSVEAAAKAASQAEAKAAENERSNRNARALSEFQAKVTAQLKDPTSAQFQGVKLNSESSAACGQFNAKNSFGGFVGFQEFIATVDEVFVAPRGCGSTPVMQMSPENGTACMKFLLAKMERRLCE